LAYQVMFEADFVEHRHRGTTFFRLILAIPLFIWAALWGILVYIAAVIAWFALLFTGRTRRASTTSLRASSATPVGRSATSR